MVRQISTIGLKTELKFNYSTGYANISDTNIQSYSANTLQNDVDNGAFFDQNQWLRSE